MSIKSEIPITIVFTKENKYAINAPDNYSEMYITKRDIDFEFDALYLATFGEHRVRVGCIGVYNGKPIAGGFNTFRNIARNVHFTHATYHAEMNVIRMIPPERISKTTLYITRLNLQGDRMPSKPCDRCMTALEVVKAIVYTDDNLNLVKVRL